MTFKMRSFGKAFLGRTLLAAVAVAALGGLVMLLWNAVIPTAFAGARSIEYLQALGLLVLSRILFGGFRGHGGWRGRPHWGRWQAMTPEEREQFKQGMRSGQRPGHQERA